MLAGDGALGRRPQDVVVSSCPAAACEAVDAGPLRPDLVVRRAVGLWRRSGRGAPAPVHRGGKEVRGVRAAVVLPCVLGGSGLDGAVAEGGGL